MAPKKKPEQPEPTSELAEALIELRKVKNEKEELSKKVKKLNEQEDYLEGIAISCLRQEGLDKVTVAGAGTASIKKEEYPVVKDWDRAFAWIVKRKEMSLLKKDVKASAWRDLRESGLDVPGVEALEKESLSFRRA